MQTAYSDDLLQCAVVLRRGSKSFYAASRLLPARMRGAAGAVYAFCRSADDAVDSPDARRDALERLSRRLDAIYASKPERHPIDRAFAATIERFAIPRTIPEALLEGLRWDEEGRRYESLSDARAYAARVASAVGVMMTLLMGERDRVTLARACDLGVAMQLTNIARDVGEDAARGRVYLPLDWLRAAGIDLDEWLERPRPTPALGSVVARLLDEADRLYARADHGIPMLPRDCRVAIRAARLIYADIGREVRAMGLDSVTRRAVTSRARKSWLLVRATPALVGAPARARGARADEPPLDEVRFLIDAIAGDGGRA